MSAYVADEGVVSWGRTLRGSHQLARPAFLDDVAGLLGPESMPLLATGLRRSYGDSGLNVDGHMIDMSRLDRMIAFDEATGIVTAEAGLSLGALNAWSVPRGWFLPVTPGTRFATLGGAVANDVHGKNHHTAGTFGRWIREIVLMRSDGSVQSLGPADNTGMFAATIGGLGLTGIVLAVSLQLRRIAGGSLTARTTPFGRLSDFFQLTEDSEASEYSVAWIDCLASGGSLGRGILTRADHASVASPTLARRGPKVPFDFPSFLLNRYSVSAFNQLYYAAGKLKAGTCLVPMERFFYPLDRIADWNRLYGRSGMYQYQSVVPRDAAEAATREMLRQISRAGQGSFLVVLKKFGALASPGLLSFPMEGTTLALDFPNKGQATLSLLSRLDAVVREARGRLYPAKDGRFPPEMFRNGYPALDRFDQFVDPGMSSSFWRRMNG